MPESLLSLFLSLDKWISLVVSSFVLHFELFICICECHREQETELFFVLFISNSSNPISVEWTDVSACTTLLVQCSVSFKPKIYEGQNASMIQGWWSCAWEFSFLFLLLLLLRLLLFLSSPLLSVDTLQRNASEDYFPSLRLFFVAFITLTRGSWRN